VTTLNLQVGASADDAFCDSAANNYSQIGTSMNLYGGIGTPASRAGFRFQNVTIPQATVITEAIFSIYAASVSGGINGNLYGEAADNPAAFSSGSNITGRSITTATTLWATATFPSGQFNSTDITSAIQEVLNRAGFASGNALVVLWRGRSGGSPVSQNGITTYDGMTSRAAKLDITYGASGHNPAVLGSPHGVAVARQYRSLLPT
jgi:hypothetical protein